MSTKPKIVLPDRLVTKKQLRQLQHEVESILDQAVQGSIRKEQTGANFGVNKPSQLLQEMLVLQDAELTIDSLKELKKTLTDIDKHVVTIRIVLSAEPTQEVRARIVRWFRQTMETPILVRFGIQPGIAGGCLVYTPNHRYDLSLREKILTSPNTIRQALDATK